MDDALRAKSTGLPGKSGTSIPPVSTPVTVCCVCFGRAYLDNDWRPYAGLAKNLRRFTCMAGHDTYRAFPRPRSTLSPPGPLLVPGDDQ
ncbi:hypothetical protein ES703_104776 [subsurface metagenome]